VVPYETSQQFLDYRPCSPIELLIMVSVVAPVREQLLTLIVDDVLLVVQECAQALCLAHVVYIFEVNCCSFLQYQQASQQFSPQVIYYPRWFA
jgi:hypothetical protein